MSRCQQTISIQTKCNCKGSQIAGQQQYVQKDHYQDIWTKFAKTLEEELKNQHQRHTQEVDALNSQLFQCKNNIMRLELRNKKDLGAYQQLRRQYNALLHKLKSQDSKPLRQVEVVQKVRQVQIPVKNDDLKDEVQYWKSKYEQLTPKYQKQKLQKQTLQQQNQDLTNQISKLKKIIKNSENKIQELTKSIEEKDRNIQKLNQQIQYLKNNKEVIVQTKHLFPQFKVPQKVRTQTKLQTIFVDKPVEKIVFVDVQKKVKQFVQPQRAVVNRIISCEPQRNCKCDDEQLKNTAYQTEIANLNSYIGQLQDNVNSYKAQRIHLVDVIGNKDRQLNYIQSKMKLFGSSDPPVRITGNSTVNVQVSKVKSAQPSSPKVFVKTQNSKK